MLFCTFCVVICCFPSELGKPVSFSVGPLRLNFFIEILWNCDISNNVLCTACVLYQMMRFKVIKNYGMVHICIFITCILLFKHLYFIRHFL